LKSRFGLSFDLSDPISKVAQWASDADGKYDHVFVTDSHLIWRDAYAALAACAMKTESIKIGVGVTNPYTRHVSVTANAIATIDELSKGRATLGIGAGRTALYNMHKKPVAVKEVRKAVLAIRSLIRGEETLYEGTKLRSRWSKRDIPIYIAGTGPKILQLAGEIADGAILGMGAYPPLIKYAIEEIRVGVRRANRSIDNFPIWVTTVCCISDDTQFAKREASYYAATLAMAASKLASINEKAASTLTPELRVDVDRCNEAYNYYQHLKSDASQVSEVSDRVVDAFTIYGSTSDCVRKFDRVFDEVSVAGFSLGTYSFSDKSSFIEAFARDIIPSFS